MINEGERTWNVFNNPPEQKVKVQIGSDSVSNMFQHNAHLIWSVLLIIH